MAANGISCGPHRRFFEMSTTAIEHCSVPGVALFSLYPLLSNPAAYKADGHYRVPWRLRPSGYCRSACGCSVFILHFGCPYLRKNRKAETFPFVRRTKNGFIPRFVLYLQYVIPSKVFSSAKKKAAAGKALENAVGIPSYKLPSPFSANRQHRFLAVAFCELQSRFYFSALTGA